MAALPASVDFTGSAVTEGGFKTAITSLRDYLAGLLGTDGTTATALSTLGAGFPTGTRMVFQQTAAPTGWTKDTTAALNDAVMRIVTGTVGSGGSTAFSTWNAQTSVGATTLSTAQVPAHQHYSFSTAVGSVSLTSSNYPVDDSGGTEPNAYTLLANTTAANIGLTSSSGGGGSHTHSLTHGVKYYDFIVATKD